MRTLPVIACGWILCMLALRAQSPARQPRPLPANLPETNPYSSLADLEIGRKLYNGRCAHCHGQNGEGGRGAVLNSGRFRHGGSDRELFITIRNGIPDTEMPAAFNLPDLEIWRLAGYVQQLGKQGVSEPATGDAAAGAAAYQKNGCAACHRIGSEGSFLGPDLTDIGAKRAAAYLRQSITEPSADVPLDYRPVSVTDRAGKTISGIHLNEDEYSVHLRDTTGNLRSFMKSEIAGITLPRQSLMPAYASLSPADLENLVAYLVSLQPNSGSDDPREEEVWTFDRLDNIGGHRTSVLFQRGRSSRALHAPGTLAGGVPQSTALSDHGRTRDPARPSPHCAACASRRIHGWMQHWNFSAPACSTPSR